MPEPVVLSGSSLARFLSYIDRSVEHWLWTRGKDKDGYGQFGYYRTGYRTMLKAHRVMWAITYGPVPENVLHHCDTPACVRPSHLYAGTLKQNSRDMVVRDRAFLAKLTVQQVRDIRAAVAAGAVQRQIAREYGLHFSTVFHIVKRITWKEVV